MLSDSFNGRIGFHKSDQICSSLRIRIHYGSPLVASSTSRVASYYLLRSVLAGVIARLSDV